MIVRWVRRKIEKQNRRRAALLALKLKFKLLWEQAQFPPDTTEVYYRRYIASLEIHTATYGTGFDELHRAQELLKKHLFKLEGERLKKEFLEKHFAYREKVRKALLKEGLYHVLIDTKPLLLPELIKKASLKKTPLDYELLDTTNPRSSLTHQRLFRKKNFWQEVKTLSCTPVLPFLALKRFVCKTTWKKNIHRRFNKPVKPCEYINDIAPLAKVIFPNGKSRGYFGYLLKYLYSIENLFFQKKQKWAYKPRKLTNPKLKGIQQRLLKWSRYYHVNEILGLFRKYIQLTEPVLAYYLIKKRSFKRQKKIYKIHYSLKMTFGLRRRNKLYHQAKAFFYSNKNRRKKGHLRYSTLAFFKEEFMNMGSSTMFKSKKRVYTRFGGEVMNSILHRETQANVRRWLSGRALGWNPRGQMFDSSSLQYAKILNTGNTRSCGLWAKCLRVSSTLHCYDTSTPSYYRTNSNLFNLQNKYSTRLKT